METITLVIICFFTGYFFSKSLRTKPKSKNIVTQINDKNWIVNNEFVSLEEDTPTLRLQQQTEDNKHYRNYEREKLSMDRRQISEEYIKTKEAIRKYPDFKNCVSENKLKAITEKYKKYVFMCEKLEETIILSKEEFLIKEENPTICIDWTNRWLIPKYIGAYNIYNEKTAKYYNGNVNELVAKEFKTKWY